MQTLELHITTSARTQMVDITNKLNCLLKEHQISTGVCYIFCPHTTAAVTINENADPTVVQDMLDTVNKLIPRSDQYLHQEGNSDAHIKATLFGQSETVLIKNGKLMLGTWQGVYLCEFDGPRTRSLWVALQ
jgi:secondary thiamine-phosphate synthase enzyme